MSDYPSDPHDPLKMTSSLQSSSPPDSTPFSYPEVLITKEISRTSYANQADKPKSEENGKWLVTKHPRRSVSPLLAIGPFLSRCARTPMETARRLRFP